MATSPPPHVHAEQLRMAVIGCGRIGNLHAQAIVQSPHATLVAVCDPDAERRASTARQFHCTGYEHAHDLLAHEKPEAVTIATPDHLHVDVTLAAIAACCQVFCEKPLAASVADAEQMVEAAVAREVHLAVDYNRRFAFGYRTAKELVDRGSIGKLHYAVMRVSDRVPRAAVARHPHVIFTTLLTHHLDLMRFFGGEIQRVQAHAADEPAGALLRSVSVSIKFTTGAIGTLVAGYREGQTRTAEWLELGGASGSIVVEDVTRRVVLSGIDPDQSQTFAPNHFTESDAFYDSLTEHVRVFIEHVAAGQQPPVIGEDGLVGMKLAAAAVESLATGKAIEM